MVEQVAIRDAAILADLSHEEGLNTVISSSGLSRIDLIISEDLEFMKAEANTHRVGFTDLILDSGHLDVQSLHLALQTLTSDMPPEPVVIVDMRWSIQFLDVDGTFEAWNTVVESMGESGCRFISVYDQHQLLERQMQAVMRGHKQFLAASGVYENPFWLPMGLRYGAGQEQQLAFLLGRVVPDHVDLYFREGDERGFARGATPSWLGETQGLDIVGRSVARWQIRCLGQLKVYQGGELVNWQIPGGSAQKTKALFCYLLQSGEKGAQVDRIGELIWPDNASERQKRARLHHAVAMLRKTLGGKTTIIRNGEYYALAAPTGSWTDIDAFEQACRRGLALAKQGQSEAALRQYRPAERLYAGDLFEELPIEFTHNDLEDWCRPRRRWLREMALKLLRDMSIMLRSLGQDDEALEKCQKALGIDISNEAANIEMIQVLHAQARFDAIERQYDQFLAVTDQTAGMIADTAIARLYRRLMN